MYTCREVAILLSKDADGELTALERTKLQAHLAICHTCRQVIRQFQLLNSAVSEKSSADTSASLPGLTEESKARLKKSLHSAVDNSEDD